MKYSLIITAWKEAETVKELIEVILNPLYLNLLPEMEIILVCPDDETFTAARSVVKSYNFQKFIRLQDNQEGKPAALNLALEKVRGEILIFTDGDVVIHSNALPKLVEKFHDIEIGGVTGRPVSCDSKSTIMGYWGHLLADAAHHKRSRGTWPFMSGYLYAIRNINTFRFPKDILVDDGWITVFLQQNGWKIAYAPEAIVFIKYPKTFSDWIKQKKRSVGGYEQLKELRRSYNSNQNIKFKRSIIDELKNCLYPLLYARGLKELWFSLALYPSRLYLWMVILYNRKIAKKSFMEIWKRVESTK